jgi:hypothetical protein
MLLVQEVKARCAVEVAEGEEELVPRMRVLQIVTKMAIRMGLQAHIQSNMETDISLLGK